jgi:hypothetical protein
MLKREYFECHCSTPEHRLVFTLETELDDFPELYTEVQLDNHRNIFQRAWLAIKYIFGYRCYYGYYANFNLNPEDAGRLINTLETYINEHNRYLSIIKKVK